MSYLIAYAMQDTAGVDHATIERVDGLALAKELAKTKAVTFEKAGIPFTITVVDEFVGSDVHLEIYSADRQRVPANRP